MRESTRILEPRTQPEAAALLHDLASAKAPLFFSGGGTHTIGGPNGDEAIVSTRGLNRIVEYAPEDQTVTVEAGVTLAQLSEVLATRGQRLVVDVADSQRATVGGAIAANVYGPRRLRFGSLKDLILGVSLVRADGVAARAGGKVVKNVAGFDLSKLVVGSYGTLALVTTATLRVHPLPESSAALRIARLLPPLVWNLVAALRERQLEPVAVNAHRSSDATPHYDVDILFEGFAAGVEAQVANVRALAKERGWVAAQLEPAAAQAADTNVRAGEPLRVQCTTLPSEFAQTDERSIDPLAKTLVRPLANAYPALGVFTLAGTPTPATPAALAAARERIERAGGSLVVEAQPAPARGLPAIEPWGTPPPSFPLMQQLKNRFDPERRLAAGRFIGGL